MNIKLIQKTKVSKNLFSLKTMSNKIRREYSEMNGIDSNYHALNIQNLTKIDNYDAVRASFYMEELQQEVDELFRLRKDLTKVNTEIEEIEKQSDRVYKRYLMGTLSVSSSIFGLFYHAIFNVEWLGWDIIEPITYSLETAIFILFARFYLKHMRKRSYTEIKDVLRDKFLQRRPNLKRDYNALIKRRERLMNLIEVQNKKIELY